MRAAEIRVGTEKQIIVRVRIEDCLKAGLRRDCDGSGRKAGILVGIVRRIYLQMFQQDAVGLVIKAIGHRRVSLQQHPYAKAVEIHARHRRHLGLVIGLSLDDGSHDAHLFLRQSQFFCLCDILRSPESVIGILLLLQYFLDGSRPVHFVCIRDEEGKDIDGIEPELRQQGIIVQGGGDLGAVNHHLVAYLAGNVALAAHSAGEHEPSGSLPAVVEHPGYIDT